MITKIIHKKAIKVLILKSSKKHMTLIGIKHIDIADKTLKISKYHRAIDHIFISEEFKLISKDRITDLEISDHYPVLIQIDYKHR